ncbi:MAG: THUMP domain-containing protein [Prolixibacteraceae bacterium]
MSSEMYQMMAKTFDGLEEVLKIELEEIGATIVEVVPRGVKFSGSKEMMYRANFSCRTALRILRIIGDFEVKNANDLYHNVHKMEWENYFDVSQTFNIISTVESEAFNNATFVSLKTKDAILDRFKSKLDKRPFLNTDNPDFKINIHASADAVIISLDSSGESLHKRGYRVGQNEASISEVLAAGILKIAGWKGQTDFYDTMCGSGTIAIEAALIARNIPPGIFRSGFAFETWKDFDEDLFEAVYNDDYERPFEHTIYASDISAVSVKVAEKNAKSAGVLKSIKFSEQDFAQFQPESNEGLLVINPPFGDRKNERMAEQIFNMIGTQLRRKFSGFKTWVYSGSEDGFRSIGLKPTERIPLVNGNLEYSFRLFEVYDGARRGSEQDSNADARRSFSNDRPKRDFQPRERDEGSRDRNSSGDRRSEGRSGEGRDRFSSDQKREGFSGGPRREGAGSDRKGGDFKSGDRKGFKSDRRKDDSGPGKRDGFGSDSRRDFKPKDRVEIQTSEPKPKKEYKPREDRVPKIEKGLPIRTKRPRIK